MKDRTPGVSLWHWSPGRSLWNTCSETTGPTLRQLGDQVNSVASRSFVLFASLCVLALFLGLAGCGGTTTTTAPASTTAGPATTGGTTATTGAPSGEPLIIGDVQGLTGEAGPGEIPAADALKMVVKQMNEAGGIAGHPITLLQKDMKSDPALSAPVTQEVLDAGAQIVIGPAFPGIAAGVVQTAAKKGVPVICMTATTPGVTTVGGTKAYMAAFGDNEQGAANAEYALKKGMKTAYILHSPDSEYTENTPRYFADAFEHGGGSIIGEDTFSIGQQDFAAQVTKLAALNPQPDCIYTGMMVPDTGIFMKALRDAGVTALVLGLDGNDNQVLIDFGGTGVEGMVNTTHGYPIPGSANEKFNNDLTAFLGKPSDGPALASLAGDVMAIIKAAVEKAGSLDPKALATAIDETENVEGVNGKITLKGTSGVPIKTVYLVKVVNGKMVLEDQIIPSYVPAPK
jgi:branched-chain amino acid transport system substrate-binding protein